MSRPWEANAPDDLNAESDSSSTLAETLRRTDTIAASETMGGSMLGPYRLLEPIGHGGMGEVWLAEQKQPVRRRVAIKLIKAGMDTREVVARFQSERQALALMDHPAIAKVFDAGSSPQGRPYFVMDYVSGVPITAYCDQHKLTTRERLELFVRVCEGVQHAHQKAIIHRDLKPSNILVCEVDGRPLPRIIDFGVAKATSQSLATDTLFTRAGAIIGTPGYMSPEQAGSTGLDVDTRTDVYSLGVILYELLVGARPLEFKKSEFDESVRRLREEDAPRPSTRLRALGERSCTAAQNRGVDPITLARQLRGDLDAITLKALEKDRARRYATPLEIAADIGRYLRHEPIVARPAGAGYRARKYIRRHRIAVAMAATMAVLLVSFAIAQAIQVQQIRRERDRASRITDFMTGMFQVADPTQTRGNTVTAREILDQASQQIDTGLARDPELQAHMMMIMGTVYQNLGLSGRAKGLVDRAISILSRVSGPSNPETLRARMELARALREGQSVEAEKLQRETLEIQRRKLGAEHPDTLRSMSDLAWTLHIQKRNNEAEKLAREVLASQRRILGAEHPATLISISNLGAMLTDEGRYAEAERLQREALETQRRLLGADHNSVIATMNNLGLTLVRLGRYAEAEKIERDALELRRHVLGAEHPDTLTAMQNLAMTLQTQGRMEAAEKLYRETLTIRRRVLGPEHPVTLSSMHNLAGALIQEGRYLEAEPLERETREIRRRVLGPDHPDTASSTYNLSCLAAHQGHREQALALLREAIEHGLYPWADLAIDKDLDLNSLHSDPRFATLVADAKVRAAAAQKAP